VLSTKGVWVLAEHAQEQLETITLQLVSGGRQLADKLGEEVCTIFIGSENKGLADTLAGYGVDKVYFLDSPRLSTYSAELYVEALVKFFQDENAGIVLFGANLLGQDLAPRLAARLKTGLVSGCVALEIDTEGSLILTKPTHGGRIYTKFVCSTTRPQLITVKADVFEVKKTAKTKSPEIISVFPKFIRAEPRTRTIDFIKGDPRSIGIEEAEKIVAVGRGAGNAANLQLLKELAEVLGASIAGSLGAVDEGWLPLKKMVGQTGVTVTPKLYFSCGISGSRYHVLGMKDSKVIIAVNKDRHAPIFESADIGIVGDIAEVVPAITKRLREKIKSTTQSGGKMHDD